jgi:steroid delta-isomerase-like uncharacterized protein
MPSKNERLVLRLFLELWNYGKLAVADEIFATNYVNHDPASPDFGTGPEGVKQLVTLYRNAFPDLQLTANQMIDTGQLVTTRFTSQGTHKGELRGIAPTNKPIKVEGMVIHRISRGHIVEGWVMWDALGLMQQLGVIPAMEKVKPQATKTTSN